jgi:hypothetical protein
VLGVIANIGSALSAVLTGHGQLALNLGHQRYTVSGVALQILLGVLAALVAWQWWANKKNGKTKRGRTRRRQY